MFDPPPPGERAEHELTGERAASAVTSQLSQAVRGRPFHVGCGLRCRRVESFGEVYFNCPEHGRIEWHQTTYDREQV